MSQTQDTAWTKTTAMRCLRISVALVCAQSSFVAARTPDKSCCEMKVIAAANAPARLIVTITNLSAAVVSSVINRAERDFEIHVKSAAGDEVARTEEGKRLLREPPEGSFLRVDLKTGRELQARIGPQEGISTEAGSLPSHGQIQRVT